MPGMASAAMAARTGAQTIRRPPHNQAEVFLCVSTNPQPVAAAPLRDFVAYAPASRCRDEQQEAIETRDGSVPRLAFLESARKLDDRVLRLCEEDLAAQEAARRSARGPRRRAKSAAPITRPAEFQPHCLIPTVTSEDPHPVEFEIVMTTPAHRAA